MNLHSIVAPYIGAINPNIEVQWKQSNGYVIDANYKQQPQYVQFQTWVQKQALSFKDLVQLQGVNLNGEACAFYVNGNIQGVLRPDARGGDIFILGDGSIWLVVHVLENWNYTAGWTKCAVVKQNGS